MKACRLDHQDDDQENECESVRESSPACAFDEVLTDTYYKGSDDSSRYGTDTSEYCSYESLETRHSTRHRVDACVVGEIEDGSDRGESAAYYECDCDDPVDVYAHERAGFEVTGDRAHRHTDLGMLDEHYQQEHENDRQHRCDDSDHLGGSGTDLYRLLQEADLRICLCETSGNVEREVLQQV